LELRRVLPATPLAPSEARMIVRTFKGVLPEPVVDDMAVIATELSTNVVQHAGLPSDSTLELRIHLAPPVVRIEIRDEGTTEISIQDAPADPTIVPESGMGLRIIGALASRWSLEKIDGTAAWAEIDLA